MDCVVLRCHGIVKLMDCVALGCPLMDCVVLGLAGASKHRLWLSTDEVGWEGR